MHFLYSTKTNAKKLPIKIDTLRLETIYSGSLFLILYIHFLSTAKNYTVHFSYNTKAKPTKMYDAYRDLNRWRACLSCKMFIIIAVNISSHDVRCSGFIFRSSGAEGIGGYRAEHQCHAVQGSVYHLVIFL